MRMANCEIHDHENPIFLSLKDQHTRTARLLKQLESGKWWTSDRPGRATAEEINAQIQQIKAVLAEIERAMPLRSV